MEQPTLETERLILRPFVDGDAPRIAELAGDYGKLDTEYEQIETGLQRSG